MPDHIYLYAARLVRKTRPSESDGPGLVEAADLLGSRPAGRAVPRSLAPRPGRRCSGSYMVRLEDIEAVAEPVLTHRLITTFAAQAEGIDAKQIVRRLVEETKAIGIG